MGTLYVVPTPIGNLDDITLRSLAALKEADLIACEDTRHSAKLLFHYQIQKPLISFFSHNQFKRIPELVDGLRAGKAIALISDSGTPGISDPGYFLIKAALDAGQQVTALPGPSALVTALVASGLPADGFVFLGFLKRKPGKMKKELTAAAAPGKTVIFYESPHRIHKTIALCAELFPPETPAVIARELTKKFEEYLRGTLESINYELQKREMKGEIVVLISPHKQTREKVDE